MFNIAKRLDSDQQLHCRIILKYTYFQVCRKQVSS